MQLQPTPDKTFLAMLSDHLQQRSKIDGDVYDKFIEAMPPSIVRNLYDFQVQNGLISTNVELTKSNLPLAIMTFIAMGQSLGAELENTFPEHKGANPVHSFQ